MEKVFWKDDFTGKARGGYFVRNSLKEFFDKLEEKGINPVGIKYDGTYNLEIIVEEKDEPELLVEEEHEEQPVESDIGVQP